MSQEIVKYIDIGGELAVLLWGILSYQVFALMSENRAVRLVNG